MDEIFKEITRVHVDQTTTDVTVHLDSIFPTGFYAVVALPLITAQDGIDEGTYIFKAGSFVISHSDHRITSGQSAIFNRSGQPDFWGINATYVDTATKDEILLRCGGGQVLFMGGHDLCFIRVKGD